MKKSTLKILCVHQGFELYGSDRSFLMNLEFLKKFYGSETDIQVIIPRSGPIVDEIKKITPNLLIEDVGQFPGRQLKKAPVKTLWTVLKMSFVARKRMQASDLVYINTIAPLSYVIAVAWLGRKNVLLHVREIPHRLLVVIFSNWFRLFRFHLIYNSTATRRAFGMDKYKRGTTLPNAVEEVSELPSADSYMNGKINLLLIGRINSWKGHDLLVTAFSRLSELTKNKYRIRFVGDTARNQGYRKDELKKMISENALNEHIELLPFTNFPAEAYNWADIVIVPSKLPEPFGRVAVEAFSLAKPVIAANHGGLGEIIRDKVNGWHFSPNNTKELCAILDEIWQKPEEIKKLGEQAKIDFHEKYSREVYYKEFVRVMSDLTPETNA